MPAACVAGGIAGGAQGASQGAATGAAAGVAAQSMMCGPPNVLPTTSSSTSSGESGSKGARANKVDKTVTTEKVGKFTKTTEVRPGRDPGQSRAEYVRYKNERGEVIRTHKDSYDRAGNFQGRKPLRGDPEGRSVGE